MIINTDSLLVYSIDIIYFQERKTSMQSEHHSTTQEIYEGRWQVEEHLKFLQGVMVHGKDWKIIESVVKTRNSSQARSHAQKFFAKLSKINKERRKGKNKDLNKPTEIQSEILENFTQANITDNTPIQIVNLINKDWTARPIIDGGVKKTERSFKKSYQEQKKPENKQEHHPLPSPIKNPFQWLRTYENNSKTESYFMQFLNMNKDGFLAGKPFNHFVVNFNSQKTQKKEEKLQQMMEIQRQNIEDVTKIRSRSFTLFDEEDDSVKLKDALDHFHRMVGDRP